MSKLEYRDIKQPNYRHIGKYTPRKDARDIVTGKAIFLDDFSVPHMLYGKTKRSPYPHAKILSIDTSKAEALPGVRAVVTHKNMPEKWGLGLPVHRLLMEDKVYFVGDLVALVAADTEEIATEALDLIDVEYEQLEAVFSAEDALKEGAVEIYPRFKGNHVDNGIKYFQPDGPWWQIIRGDVKKGFEESVLGLDADFICLQETKMEQGQAHVDLPGYEEFWNSAEKKGYSGTAIFTRHKPLSVRYGMGLEPHDHEGRLITLEYPEFYLVNCYTPNAQNELARIDYRMEWERDLRAYLMELDKTKPVIYCGDLNVAHKEIDLKNPGPNRGKAGFSDQEREQFGLLLDSGFVDTFRYLYPDLTGAYSWWSYRFNARANNAGWRIDYFVVSQRLAEKVQGAFIHPDIYGSDHCPVSLDLEI